MIHYGPVWYRADGQRRPTGSSLALCSVSAPTLGDSRTLSTHEPWVDCPECQKLMAAKAMERRA